jgi:hypothetical protein
MRETVNSVAMADQVYPLDASSAFALLFPDVFRKTARPKKPGDHDLMTDVASTFAPPRAPVRARPSRMRGFVVGSAVAGDGETAASRMEVHIPRPSR